MDVIQGTPKSLEVPSYSVSCEITHLNQHQVYEFQKEVILISITMYCFQEEVIINAKEIHRLQNNKR